MKLFYKKYGEQGPPIFILHGVFGMLDNWHNIARKLSEKYTVYTVDQRNHGKSPHSPSMTYPEMADDLAELMDDLNIPDAHILGHSMGGKVAMTFAEMHPDKVRSLIVADIAPKAYPAGHIQLMNALDKLDYSAIEKRSDADKQLSQYIPNHGIRLFLLKNLQVDKDGEYSLKMNLPAIRANYEKIIGKVEMSWPFSGPCLFMKGANSGYITDEDEEEITSLFPNAEFVTISNSGHWLHAENPKEFVQALEDFLAKNN